MEVLNLVETLKDMGYDYFSFSTEGLKNLNDSPLSGLYNSWASVHENGADLRVGLCQVGDRVMVSVHEVDDVYGLGEDHSVIALFPLDKWGVEAAKSFMYKTAEMLSE